MAVSLPLALSDHSYEGLPTYDRSQLVFTIPFLAFICVGTLIALRLPRHPVGWLFALAGLGELLFFFGYEYAAWGLFRDPGAVPFPATVHWFTDHVASIAFGLFPLILLLYPTGKLLSSRWRAAVGVVVIAEILFIVRMVAVWPFRGPTLMAAEIESADIGWADATGEIAFPLIALGMLLAAVSLIVRFRRSSGTERRQIEWLAYAAVFAVATLLLDGVGMFGSVDPLLIELLGALSVASIPAAAGIAILRYRLYDIDLVINKTLVYVTFTVVLAGIYFTGVTLLQSLLRPLTQESELAVATSTLAVAGLFRPVRRRVQGFIDYRFYRRRYDAARTIDAFSTRLRDQIDLSSVTEELVGVVHETVHPTHVSVWLRPTQEAPNG